jgi:hypothetical protein
VLVRSIWQELLPPGIWLLLVMSLLQLLLVLLLPLRRLLLLPLLPFLRPWPSTDLCTSGAACLRSNTSSDAKLRCK